MNITHAITPTASALNLTGAVKQAGSYLYEGGKGVVASLTKATGLVFNPLCTLMSKVATLASQSFAFLKGAASCAWGAISNNRVVAGLGAGGVALIFATRLSNVGNYFKSCQSAPRNKPPLNKRPESPTNASSDAGIHSPRRGGSNVNPMNAQLENEEDGTNSGGNK